jgi:HlyD family secretion protein
MSRRWIIIVIILVLVGGGVAFRFLSHEKPKIKWRTAKIEQGDLKVAVTATGTLSAVTTVQVGTQVSGTIAAIHADFNSTVKKGQVIAELDRTFLETSVQDTEASVARTQVQVQMTKRAQDRAKELAAQSLLAPSDLDTAVTNYESAQAELRSAQAQLDRARVNLRYATILSPVDGVVISRSVDVGQTVAASFNTPTLFIIAADLTKMQVQASVDEADIGQVKLDQVASFTVDAYPSLTFAGRVAQIRFQPVVVQNVVTYTVIINVENPDLKLLPGMTANLSIAVTEHKNVLKVLSSALRFSPPSEAGGDEGAVPSSRWSGGGSGNGGRSNSPSAPAALPQAPVPGGPGTLWLLDAQQKPKSAKVKVGLSDGTFTEVEGEVRAGDDVITGVVQESSTTTPSSTTPLGMPRRF